MPPKGKAKAGKPPHPPSHAHQTHHTTQSTPPRPNWPLLTPIVPSTDLTLHPLLEDQILLIPNFFTATLCKTYVTYLSGLPLTTTPGKPKRGEAVRVNDRFQIEDAGFARRLWEDTSLADLVTGYHPALGPEKGGDAVEQGNESKNIWGGQVLGLNPNIRIYRYRPGQFFDKHYDESNRLVLETSNPSGVKSKIPAKTTWTLLIYLSRSEGGETVFYPEGPRKGPTPDAVVARVEPGMALLHRHGEECLLHEGREVLSGEKWVLRSDLVVRR